MARLSGVVLFFGLSIFEPSAAFAQVFTTPQPTASPTPRPTSTPAPRKPATRKPTPPPRTRQQLVPVPIRAPARPIIYSDPVPYCQANADIDQPNSDYRGPGVPTWMSRLITLSSSNAVSSQPAAQSWRCMNRRVLACTPITGQFDCSKPSQERVSTPDMALYCKGKRRGEIPYSVTGMTVLIWTCANGEPTISGNRAGADGRGYLSQQWVDVTDFAPGNLVGAMPRTVIGTWGATIQGQGFLFKIPYTINMQLRGGDQAHQVGTIQYYATELSGRTTLFCESALILASVSFGAVVLQERPARVGNDGRCPAGDVISVTPRDGQISFASFKAKSTKARMTGLLQRQD